MESLYNFVYVTTNCLNGKLYVGVHKTNKLDDGYIGNGVISQRKADRYVEKGKPTPFQRAVSIYGYWNFSRKILKYFTTYDEALMYEQSLITLNMIKGDQYYNVSFGGKISPTTGIGHSEESKRKMSLQRKGIKMKGEKNPKAKLTESKVSKIRSLKGSKTTRELSVMFLVSISTIRDIFKNRTWT